MSCNWFVWPWPPYVIRLPYDRLCSSHTDNLSIKTLVAKWWQTHINVHTHYWRHQVKGMKRKVQTCSIQWASFKRYKHTLAPTIHSLTHTYTPGLTTFRHMCLVNSQAHKVVLIKMRTKHFPKLEVCQHRFWAYVHQRVVPFNNFANNRLITLISSNKGSWYSSSSIWLHKLYMHLATGHY